ncbi:MAG TPA: enolase C-terminal domain-like protein [Trebonia sp.]
MPRIHIVTVHRRSVPLVRPFVTAIRGAHEVDAVLVEVRDDDGRSGWGEAPTSWRVTGESPASVTAAREVAAGFLALKVKAGAGGDDVATLAAVRNAVGPGVTLRVDANQGWTPRQAVAVIGAWEDAGLGVELVEQPVHADDLAGMAFVTDRVATPVLADESVWTRRDLRQVVAEGAADMVNIKLAKTGGLREALGLARLAREHGIGVLVGCMAETHVGIASAAALASALTAGDAGVAQDLDGGLWLTASPVVGGVAYDGDSITLPELPGTGIRGLAR